MTLLDSFLPHHDVSEISARKVAGAPSAVWAAVQTADLNRSWALRALLHLRALPHAVLRAAFRTETRVSATSPRSRRVFRLYWMVVGPFSAYLRRVMLDAIAAETIVSRRASVAD